MRLIIGISGASGVIYGIRLLQLLRDQAEVETHLVMSRTAKLNVTIETDWKVSDVVSLADEVHHYGNLAASISSGSFRVDGMIIAPCSMKTLSAIVSSYTDNLLTRSADVVRKERRKLVLMPRESPLHQGHCKLLYQAASLGAIIAPPVPAFYNRPKSLEEMIDHTVGRVLDLFGLQSDIVKRWQGMRAEAEGN